MKCEYTNNGERITAPGKFEGEPVFAPYFWSLALEGFADSDNGTIFRFRFAFGKSDEDKRLAKEWPSLKRWLGRKRTLTLFEDSQGFVYCR